MKQMISLLLICAFVFACSSKESDKQAQLLDKVMEVHDAVMPKMGDIMKYKTQLNSKIDELIAAGEEQNAETIAQLKDAVEQLDNSHEGMMSWMRNFDQDFEGKVEEEVMEYLKDQQAKIEEVSTVTNTALKNAEELLAQ